jgi:hypothetical protein
MKLGQAHKGATEEVKGRRTMVDDWRRNTPVVFK